MKGYGSTMKFQRHNLILKLIEEESIETQKELSDRLRAAGFLVTQATVSRDIKELRLVKVLDHDDKYKYAVAAHDTIFLVMRDEQHAAELCEEIQAMLK